MISKAKEVVELQLLLKKHWEQPSTLILVLLSVAVTGLIGAYEFDFLEMQREVTWVELAFIAVALGAISLVWYETTRLPRCPEGKIGLLIAINCETKKERDRLKNDFVISLQDEIRKGNHQHFHVLELSESRAANIQTHHEAMKYLTAIGAHLIVYGSCRLRMHKGHSTYVFELSASVRHAPIPIAVSKQFSADMNLALPKKTLFWESDELSGFEFTRGIVGIASRYILGIAYSVSNDPSTAFDLHHGVRCELARMIDQESDGIPVFRNLNVRTANLLVQEGLAAATLRFTRKPPRYLADMRRYLDVVQEIDPSHYGGHLLRGIYLFLDSRDVEGAKKEIKKAKNDRDSAWLWSSAFLEAYEGRLEEAHKIYQRAFRGEVTDATPLQVETFIVDVLNVEPDKIQLWYCLGMINYLYKGDLASAKSDFVKFCDLASQAKKFGRSVGFTTKYLREIEGKLSQS